MKTSKNVRFLTQAAVIAALYAVLTYAAAAANLAYGPVQFRFSEALTVLPFFTPAAVPGLTLGCFLSNLASPLGVVDWVFGSLATLLAALWTRSLRGLGRNAGVFLAPLPPVLANGVIVGLEVACLNEAGFSWAHFSWAAFAAGALSVAAGELAVCYALGLPLLLLLRRMGAEERIFA